MKFIFITAISLEKNLTSEIGFLSDTYTIFVYIAVKVNCIIFLATQSTNECKMLFFGNKQPVCGPKQI